MQEFSAESLPEAIRKIFELNFYKVDGPSQIHGAEVDLIATPLANPFGSQIYIEATVEYVDNTKYGKDMGKLAMFREMDPNAQLLIVSSKGFSLPVKERAEKTRILTLTYDELFKRFERFGAYVEAFTESEKSIELKQLSKIYEEPSFDDIIGNEQATEYLSQWRDGSDKHKGWLIVVGEYGTGKTALTKILQFRWLNDYKNNPSLPIPIRIELRNFTRQFDARGLLHQFLDTNNLSHISVEFVYSLIRAGRIILLLDGYDEMAQYLHARERRTCLEALAELSTDGARGIITSRPNYFTEAEELEVFEILYRSLQHEHVFLGRKSIEILEKEKSVDKLLEKFIDRFERTLRDLTPDQTRSLIKRALAHDIEGQNVVLGLLNRIFKTSRDGDIISLSGKPVIISYLLEVVETLKQASEEEKPKENLSEWEIFKLIVDQLMIRDYARSSEIDPLKRRTFLRVLAVHLSKKENSQISEASFKDITAKEFKRDLSRFPSEDRSIQLERYFADLRSSTTLTRSDEARSEGWKFSHNILREFLLTEYLIDGLRKEDVSQSDVPISDAMKSFVTTLPVEVKHELLTLLSRAWKSNRHGCGQLLSLLWDGLLSLFEPNDNSAKACLEEITGHPVDFNSIRISRIQLSSELWQSDLSNGNFVGSNFSNINLSHSVLSSADFSDSLLEDVDFSSSNLSNTHFRNSIIVDVDFSYANISGADFSFVDPDLISIITIDQINSYEKRRLDGLDALGYLKFNGAITDDLPKIVILQHHYLYPVIDKLVTKLSSQKLHQRRGMEQRGASMVDVRFAREFLGFLEGLGFIKDRLDRREQLIEVTEEGRHEFSNFSKTGKIPETILDFLER